MKYTVEEDNGFIHDVEPSTALEKRLDRILFLQETFLSKKDKEIKELSTKVTGYEKELSELRPLKKDLEKRYDSWVENRVYATLNFEEELSSLVESYMNKGVSKEELIETLEIYIGENK